MGQGMMEKICKNCKYCVPSNGYGSSRQDKDLTCESPTSVQSYVVGNCPSGGIQVEIDEGWGIIVSPTFGCINWVKA